MFAFFRPRTAGAAGADSPCGLRSVKPSEKANMPGRTYEWMPTDAEVAEAFAHLGVPGDPPYVSEFTGAFNRSFHYRDAQGSDRVLRMRPRWMTERRMAFEHAFARHQSERGTPVLAPTPIGSSTWFRVRDVFCELYPFVEGRSGTTEPAEVYRAGTLLGRFHRRGQDFDRRLYEPPEVQSQLDPWELRPRLDVLRRFAGGDEVEGVRFTGDAGLFDKLWARWPVIEDAYPRDCASWPRAYRHGDFHLSNLLVSDCDPGRILALLDLDMVAEGTRIYDVSYALHILLRCTAWETPQSAAGCGAEGWRAICREFLRGYHDAGQGPFTSDEIAVVPLQIECVAILFLSHNVVREPDANRAEGVLRDEYLDIADWLDRYQAELAVVLEQPTQPSQ